MSITRRDFLNGIALTIAAGATPLAQLAFASDYTKSMILGSDNIGPDYYPPKLTGIRGSHDGSFEASHFLGRANGQFTLPTEVEENYDLIIVGGGISGLTAALLYQEKFGTDKKILILENHDDFGGHAKRNEFTTDQGTLITYGGSESLQSPRSDYSENAMKLINSLGVELDNLESHFDVGYYTKKGLSKGVFFDKEHFGVNKIVGGDPGRGPAYDIPVGQENGRPIADFINDFPMSETDRQALIELHEEKIDYLADMTLEEKEAYLDSHSYSTFLRDKVKLSDQAVLFFQQMPHDFMASGIDAMSVSDARACDLPGFKPMGLPPLDEHSQAVLDDLYIHHFPDGNASLTRLMVRKLIPSVAPGNTMEDVVLAKFDYTQLDRPEHNVRIRLNSTAVNVENLENGQGTSVVYLQDGKTHRINSQQTIMACYNMMIPYIVPTMPEDQKMALRHNVKFPLVYTKVALKNWKPFKESGVHLVYSPSAPYSTVKLNYPVSMGGYEFAKDENDPVVAHMIYVPTMADSSLPPAKQAAMGRANLLGMTFDAHEKMVRDQLEAMFGEYGFTQDDILGITVNRWSHGYAYYPSTLFDDAEYFETAMTIANKPFGNIYIANSDSEWSAYAHSAMDAAFRTIDEITEKENA